MGELKVPGCLIIVHAGETEATRQCIMSSDNSLEVSGSGSDQPELAFLQLRGSLLLEMQALLDVQERLQAMKAESWKSNLQPSIVAVCSSLAVVQNPLLL